MRILGIATGPATGGDTTVGGCDDSDPMVAGAGGGLWSVGAVTGGSMAGAASWPCSRLGISTVLVQGGPLRVGSTWAAGGAGVVSPTWAGIWA